MTLGWAADWSPSDFAGAGAWRSSLLLVVPLEASGCAIDTLLECIPGSEASANDPATTFEIAADCFASGPTVVLELEDEAIGTDGAVPILLGAGLVESVAFRPAASRFVTGIDEADAAFGVAIFESESGKFAGWVLGDVAIFDRKSRLDAGVGLNAARCVCESLVVAFDEDSEVEFASATSDDITSCGGIKPDRCDADWPPARSAAEVIPDGSSLRGAEPVARLTDVNPEGAGTESLICALRVPRASESRGVSCGCGIGDAIGVGTDCPSTVAPCDLTFESLARLAVVPAVSEEIFCEDACPATGLVVGIPESLAGTKAGICADASSISENDFGASPLRLGVGDEVGAAGIAAVPMFGPIAITVV
jgi:hypothetical protein